jgi:DHA1 family inner membrane transport protein
MPSVAPERGGMVPVVALSLSAFAVGTAELIIMGLLPAIATDLSVDIPMAGLLITGYAIGVAVASPVLALLTSSMSRKLLLLGVMCIFVVSNALCAIATTYWELLAFRLVVACCHGLFFGVAVVIAMRLAPEGRHASAISLVVAGNTLSQILGVPIGTAIGNSFGWRTAFWAIAAASIVAAVAVWLLVPRVGNEGAAKSNLRAEVAAATRPGVLLCYGIIVLFMTGVFSFFAYIVPLLTTVSGVPTSYVPWVLVGMGVAGFFGNLAGGRLGDWRPTATMVGILATVTVLLVVLSQATAITWATITLLWLIWLSGFGFVAPVQARIVKAASDAPNFASTLISTAFNIGIAGGAALGGATLAAGWNYSTLPLIGAAMMTLALIGTLMLGALDRRTAKSTVPLRGVV